MGSFATETATEAALDATPAASPGAPRWRMHLLTSVEPQPESGRTLVRWQNGLGQLGSSRLEVHVLRKRAAVFGHNAPDWKSLSRQFRRDYLVHEDNENLGDNWPESEFVLSPASATSDGGFVDLDTTLPEVRPGNFVVLTKAKNAATGAAAASKSFEVVSVEDVSRADFALSGKITRLQLRGSDYGKFQKSVRDTSVLAGSEPLEFAEYPVSVGVSGDVIPIAFSAEGLLPGRRLIVRGTTESGELVAQQVTLEAVTPKTGKGCELKVSPALAHTLVRDSVVVHANVVLASHGETVSQILGAGNAGAPFQRFALNQQPVTHRAAANEIGAKSELVVRVSDVAWQDRPTLFGAAPDERVYALSTNEQGQTFAQFGDGARGARLPSGVNNVRAKYRKGLGAGGNVGSGKLTQLLTRPLGLKSVENPLPAEGGTDPERPDAARQRLPLTARTLGRVVSLLDYEDFARAFSGIAKARAEMLPLPAGSTISITIAGAAGAPLTPASPVWENLLQALRSAGDPHVAMQLLAYEARTFELGLELEVDPAYERIRVFQAVEAALRTHYGFEARRLSEPVQQSEVVAIVHQIPGVVGVDLTDLQFTSPPASGNGTLVSAAAPLSQKIRLLAARPRVESGVALPAELLTLAPGPLRRLEVMT